MGLGRLVSLSAVLLATASGLLLPLADGVGPDGTAGPVDEGVDVDVEFRVKFGAGIAGTFDHRLSASVDFTVFTSLAGACCRTGCSGSIFTGL